MKGLRHFAINADDTHRARLFYESVLGFRFEPFGPPDFFQIDTGAGPGGGTSNVQGALQKRRALHPQLPTIGFECTFAVDDVPATIAAALAAGGRVLMEKSTIEGVGDLAFLQDTEGNAFGIMRYF